MLEISLFKWTSFRHKIFIISFLNLKIEQAHLGLQDILCCSFTYLENLKRQIKNCILKRLRTIDLSQCLLSKATKHLKLSRNTKKIKAKSVHPQSTRISFAELKMLQHQNAQTKHSNYMR